MKYLARLLIKQNVVNYIFESESKEDAKEEIFCIFQRHIRNEEFWELDDTFINPQDVSLIHVSEYVSEPPIPESEPE